MRSSPTLPPPPKKKIGTCTNAVGNRVKTYKNEKKINYYSFSEPNDRTAGDNEFCRAANTFANTW